MLSFQKCNLGLALSGALGQNCQTDIVTPAGIQDNINLVPLYKKCSQGSLEAITYHSLFPDPKYIDLVLTHRPTCQNAASRPAASQLPLVVSHVVLASLWELTHSLLQHQNPSHSCLWGCSVCLSRMTIELPSYNYSLHEPSKTSSKSDLLYPQ